MKCPKCQFENPENTYYCGRCATRLTLAAEPSITKTIQFPSRELKEEEVFAGKYKIAGEIGRGGMGIVIKAEDLKLKRTVAIKFLPPWLAAEPEAEQRFMREAQAAAILDHPNICTIYEVDKAEGRTYIAMAHIEGQSLREKIRQGPPDWREALRIAVDVAEGLAEAHRKGIIHRDIKSGNIMVKADGQAKVMDFGLAKVTSEATLTQEARTMGTVAYMSPEQARGETVDQRTDVWSFGVVLYEMLTGILPFKGERDSSLLYAIVHEEPASILSLSPKVPQGLQVIVGRCLKKDVALRYPSGNEVLRDLRAFEKKLIEEEIGGFSFRRFTRILRRPRIAIPTVLALIVLGLFAYWFFDRQAKIKWAREQALPEIKALSFSDEFFYGWNQKASINIFDIGKKAQRYISGDPEFKKFWPGCYSRVSFETDPPGARISVREYASTSDNWRFLGVSPLKDIEMPLAYYRWKVEKEGFEPEVFVAATLQVDVTSLPPAKGDKKIFRALDKIGTIPPGMVHVRAQKIKIADKEVELPDFYIDKYEVTNKEFKEFVTKGGYRTPDFWKHDFYKGGKRLSREEAMAEFVDATGIPGPATWRGGDYPEGNGEYPVTGVSWYEAAAYAEFRGQSLPTIHHWEVAAGLQEPMDAYFLRVLHLSLSNFFGKGPLPAANDQPMAASGACQMAGNVREWGWNETAQGRCVCGGAWDDPTYMFGTSQADPFDRSEKNGVRCMKDIDTKKVPAEVFGPFAEPGKLRDYRKEKLVSDEVFRVYKDQFDYDKKPLDAVVEERDESNENWIKERIVINAAYTDDNVIFDSKRMPAYLFLPKNAAPPYQVVIYFPAQGEGDPPTSRGEIENQGFKRFDFIVKNGRAFMHPIYLYTYERKEKIPLSFGRNSREYVQSRVHLVQDCKRSIDYLETRGDIDTSKLAFFGWSWGVRMGKLILAVEDRIKAGVFVAGGLDSSALLRPEIDPFNYVPRIKAPILMLNGKYDTIFPYEVSVKPMFDLLGTPEKDKFLKLYETDHGVPTAEVIKETQAFLNKYLGPVK